jgi:hypothetical protein
MVPKLASSHYYPNAYRAYCLLNSTLLHALMSNSPGTTPHLFTVTLSHPDGYGRGSAQMSLFRMHSAEYLKHICSLKDVPQIFSTSCTHSLLRNITAPYPTTCFTCPAHIRIDPLWHWCLCFPANHPQRITSRLGY